MSNVDDTSSLSTNAPPARLLVVDDLEINRDLIQAILSSGGYRVDLVHGGRAAIEALRTTPYHLVLMGVRMPDADGIKAAIAIRALPGAAGATPIVAMTADAVPEQIARCRAAGMNDHVEKPIRRDVLLATIDRTLKTARDLASIGAEPDAPVFDQGLFDELREMLSAETVATLLTKLVVHLCRSFTPDLLRTADAARLASEAHKMVSMAGMMGFARLSVLCAALERACGEGLARDGLIARVDQARDDVLTRIARLRVV